MNKFFSIENFKKNWYWYIICAILINYAIEVNLILAECYSYEFNDLDMLIGLDLPEHMINHAGWYAGVGLILFLVLCVCIICIFKNYLFGDKKTNNETNSQLNNVSK